MPRLDNGSLILCPFLDLLGFVQCPIGFFLQCLKALGLVPLLPQVTRHLPLQTLGLLQRGLDCAGLGCLARGLRGARPLLDLVHLGSRRLGTAAGLHGLLAEPGDNLEEDLLAPPRARAPALPRGCGRALCARVRLDLSACHMGLHLCLLLFCLALSSLLLCNLIARGNLRVRLILALVLATGLPPALVPALSATSLALGTLWLCGLPGAALPAGRALRLARPQVLRVRAAPRGARAL
mmetsp:Transcript_109926/g.310720  ORF Transcript_109926/g.310720 Transcript_109926/m.310720 type:complete len:238 (+) Transcript_109926:1673-2386(+)